MYSLKICVFVLWIPVANYAQQELNQSNSTDETPNKQSSQSEESDNQSNLIHPRDQYCTCDLKPFLCDINCCCDQLCTPDERKLFSRCKSTSRKQTDLKYCYSKSLIYTINAIHEAGSLSSSLFCIEWDNAAMKDEYPERSAISTLSEVKRLQQKYSWSSQHVEDSEMDLKRKHRQNHGPLSRLKAGHAIRIVQNSNTEAQIPVLDTWKLPHATLHPGGLCDSFVPVSYLTNFVSSCTRIITDLRKDCSSASFLSPKLYHENFLVSRNKAAEVVVGSLHFARHYLHEAGMDSKEELAEDKHSLARECLDGECVAILVNGSYDLPQFVYDSQRKVGACFNVVTKVSYDISFEAKTGITEILVTFKQNPIAQGQKYLKQTFQVTFNQEINSSQLFDHDWITERSGNPGYLFGKPILVTSFKEDLNSTGPSKLAIPMLSKSDGSCQETTNTLLVQFRKNVKTGCRINLKSSTSSSFCSDLQKEITTVWKNGDSSHIAIFGNSNSSNINHWTPIILDNSMAQLTQLGEVPVLTLDGNCPSIVTSVSYEVYFAEVGLKSEPQAMIVSVVKRFSDPIEVKVQRPRELGQMANPWIEVSMSVSFHDVTKPSRPSFAPPPTVKIQLPADFFYPFFVSSSGHLSTKCNFIWLPLILTTVLKL